ncbi:hypothetical protein N7516_002101 [Penicillium verrucosum]|uniref:uncharacterized protein n=1 Tax=Penicillium verrucosum TaxID=60171 RepID=UPI002544D78A|nr:uncharacterized protein N7516_002101 [Penicillium verrucosum]KAJ5941933.1 hypothetical protein N7516_002101 [Penicillium verrucosum]
MAELVGLVASIAGLVQIAGQITKLSYSYVSDIKSAPRTQKMYLQEVSALTDVLFRVEKTIQEAESTDLELPSLPSSLNEESLQECRRHLLALHLDLDKRLRRLVWPFQEKEVKKYIDLLHRYRSLFADFLSTNIMSVATATYKRVAGIDQEQMRQYLYSLFPASDNLLRSRPNACPGTGKWFLNSQDVENWRTGDPSLLWCYGAPGVGKSLLSSITIGNLWDQKSEAPSSVVYVFCQFSSREQQTLTAILQCMIRQVIEQADEKVLFAMKHLFVDPIKQREPVGLAESFATACELKSTYLLVDGLDEVTGADGLLSYLSSFVENGCKVMVTSRDLGHIRKAMDPATKMEICSQVEDLEIYIDSRFQKNELPRGAQKLIGKITEKSGNMFLHTKLILDEILDLTTVRHMQKALEKQSKGLNQVYQSTLQRIDMQPMARRNLARRFIGWVVYAKRPLKIDEVIHAFAVEDDEDYIEEDNFVSPDLLLRSCVGLVVLLDDNTVAMVHATAYDFFGPTVLLPCDMETDIAETCLRYMCLSPFKEGPCTSRVEMSRRFDEMLFLDYASRHWARHIKEIESVGEDLNSLVQYFICNEKLLNAAVQALNFRNELDTDLLDSLFDSIPQDQTALHVAAYWNLTGTLSTLIESGFSTSLTDTHGWTPLHYSCANGHFASAEILVRNGADVDATDNQDWTPLFWASFTGSLDIVRLLLSEHAKYTNRSKYGWTALHWAISRGETEVVLELVQHHQAQLSRVTKADIRTLSVEDVRRLNTPENTSPIKIAAEGKNATIFDLLVAHFDAPDSTREEDFQKIWSRESFRVPISRSTWRNTFKSQINGEASRPTELIAGETYIEEEPSNYFRYEFMKEDPSAWKSNLLVSAIQDGDFQAAKLFLELGADVNYFLGEVPLLDLAAQQRDPRFVQLLLEKSSKELQAEMTEVILCTAISLGNLETAKVILDSDGAPVNQNGTPLHAAASQQDPQFVLLLLSKGARPGLLDGCDQTALSVAVTDGFVETARALIDGGADVNQLSHLWICYESGWRPCLNMAVYLAGADTKEQGRRASGTEMTRMLLSKGASIEFKDEEGKTALHMAAAYRSVKCVEILMAAGSTVETVDGSGRTPIHTMMEAVKPSWDVEEVEEVLRLLFRGLSEDVVILLLAQKTCQTIVYDSSDDEDIQLDTPLTSALKKGAWSIARLLMTFGAEAPTSSSFRPIVTNAVRGFETQIVEILIGGGISPAEDAALDLVKSIDEQLLAKPSSLLYSSRETLSRSRFDFWFLQAHVKHNLEKPHLSHDEVVQASQPILTSLISAGADVNFCDSEINTTPLHLAAEKIPIAQVTAALLDFGADCFHSFENQFDPILTAAAFNNTECLRCLLAHASKSPKPGHWTQYLEYQGQLSNKEMFDCICLALKLACKLNYKNSNDETLLHLAANTRNAGLVISLISHGAYADIPDEDGFFPIHCAAFASGHSDIVRRLLPVNMVQHTSEHHPYRSVEARSSLRDEEICRQIANITNKKGNTMLWEALENEDESMFLHLLKLESDFNSCATLPGKHPSLLYHACAREMTEAVSFLLECNVDIERADNRGWRPLHGALNWHNMEIIEKLIAAGADVCASTTHFDKHSSRDSDHDRKPWNGHALHLAVLVGNIDIIELLLKHGADVSANAGFFKRRDGRICGPTALHIALDPRAWYTGNEEDWESYEDHHEDYLNIARMLIQNGAPVEGVLDQLRVKDIPSFEGFEDVWDKIRGV